MSQTVQTSSRAKRLRDRCCGSKRRSRWKHTTACAHRRGNDDAELVYGSIDHPRFLGQGLTPELISGEACLDGAVDIVKFAPAGHARARDARLDVGRSKRTATVHHERSTGMLDSLTRVAQLCRDAGVELIVGVTYRVFAICEQRALATLRRFPRRSCDLSPADQHRFLEKTGQMQFSSPVQIVYALDHALLELDAEGGVDARRRRDLENWQALASGTTGLGFRRLLPEAILARILTTDIEPDHPNDSSDAMHDTLYAKGFTTDPGKGPRRDTYRLANKGDVGASDMHAFVAAMRDTLTTPRVQPLSAS